MNGEKKLAKIGPPHMDPLEVDLLRAHMESGISTYLEFGLGGSTLLAVRAGIEQIVSVDSDLSWVRAVSNHAEIVPKIVNGSMSVLYADIGPVGSFGSPTDLRFKARWPSYIKIAWNEWERRGQFPNLILVDGRFRTACCLSVLLAWHLSGRPNPCPTILIHDIVPERKSYTKIFEFYNVIESAMTLRVIRPAKLRSGLGAFVELLDAQFDGA